MKKYLYGFSLLLALPLMANAFMLYDVDFESPTYTDGQNIGTGTGQTIHTDIAGFITQALLIHDGGSYSFNAPETYTSGVHRISWDMAAPAEQSASSIITAQLAGESILFAARMTTSHPLGQVIAYEHGGPYDPGAPFNFDQSYSLDVLIDLDANYYNFWLDGTLLSDHVGIASDADLSYVNFSQYQYLGLQAGIDNFQGEVNASIPETSTVSLLLLGLPSLGFAHGIFKPRKQKTSQ